MLFYSGQGCFSLDREVLLWAEAVSSDTVISEAVISEAVHSEAVSWVDDGDDYQTLYKMVYNDFQGESQRSGNSKQQQQ